MVPADPLRRWLDVALVKKLGVLKQPYLVWPADPKINPPAGVLLLAALLLDDADAVATVAGIAAAEAEERLKAKGGQPSAAEIAAATLAILQQALAEMLPDSGATPLQAKLRRRACRFGLIQD
ncbi:MAG: hypothetical protein AB1413_04155 [Thermodesulfobacteriota bacterium]